MQALASLREQSADVTTAAPGAPARPEVDPGYPRRLLVTVLLAVVGFSMSMTIVSASLTEIADDLGTSATTLSWAVTGLFLAMAVSTPVLGKLGDTHGHRTVFLIGAAVLTAATIGCVFAWNTGAFIGFRMLVGVGIAATMPNGMALVLAAYPLDQRAQAMGWYQMAMTGAPVLGLIAGGPIVDAWGWRVVFALLAPLGIAGFVAAWRVVRDDGVRRRVPIDWLGVITLGLGILSFLLALEAGRARGYVDPLTLVLLALAPLFLVGFVRAERTNPSPLLPLRYLRRPNFVGPLLSQSLAQFAYMGGFLLTPLYLDDVFGLSVSAIALLLLFRPGTFSICSPIGGRLNVRFGPRPLLLVGSALMTASMLAFAASAAFDRLWVVVVGLALSGMAAGLPAPSFSTTVAAAVDPQDLGVANGMSSTTMNIGMLTGIQCMFVLLGDDRSQGRFGWVFVFGAAVAALSVVGGLLVRNPSRTAVVVNA